MVNLLELSPDPTQQLRGIYLCKNRSGTFTAIHNAKARMPAIMRREDHQAWLSGTQDEALACLKPYPEDRLLAHTVSRAVNSPVNDGPEVIRPIDQN